MKTLITAAVVKDVAQKKETTINVGPNSIVTPAARDAAKAYGINIIINEMSPCLPEAKNTIKEKREAIDSDLIARIVGEVMACLKVPQQSHQLIKESDVCGLQLIRGDSVIIDDLHTGNPEGKVKTKELLTVRESSNLGTGFITMDDSAFSDESKADGISYILEGNLTCIVNGKEYRGKAGDTFYIPSHTKVTYSTSDKAKFFYVTQRTNGGVTRR